VKDRSSFLREKLSNVPFSSIAFSQCEALFVALVGWVPGIPGFAIRTLVYKCLFKRLSGMAWIQPGVTFVSTNRLTVGKHFGVNSGTYINAIGSLSIGDYVLIGSNVTISSGQHPIEGRMPPVFARPVIPKAIVIEDDVWIGAGAVIMPGTTLRRGTVVGANAVVTRDTEEYSVVVGAPAKKIRTRDGAP
jgi:acetyltransferase-like isoleucine patch superfamily enzyme